MSKIKRPTQLKWAVFPTPPWNWEVGVCHGPYKEANRYIQQLTGRANIISGSQGGHCYSVNGHPIIVWVHDMRDVPVLVHELMHGVFRILESRGLVLCDDSEEAFTYTMTDLLTRILSNKKWKVV